MDISELNQWLLKNGAKMSAKIEVTDDEIMGRGINVKEDISASEKVISIPNTCLLNYLTILKHIAVFNYSVKKYLANQGIKILPALTKSDLITTIYSKWDINELLKLSSVQLLTLYISLELKRGDNSFWSPFLNWLPNLDEFKGMPITWQLSGKKEIVNNLPRNIKKYVLNQCDLFDKDIENVQKFILQQPLEEKRIDINILEFLRVWIGINTRCLYFPLPSYLPIYKISENNLTMVPFVDFINHSVNNGENAVVKFIRGGCQVITKKEITRGNHLWFLYGPHDSIKLQCEYGFSPLFTHFDYIDITPYLTKLISSRGVIIEDFLKYFNYWGEYTIDVISNKTIKTEVNFKTKVAIACLLERPADFTKLDEDLAKKNENGKPLDISNAKKNTSNFIHWKMPGRLRRFLDGVDAGPDYLVGTKKLLSKILSKMKDEYKVKLEQLENCEISNKTEALIAIKIIEHDLSIIDSYLDSV
ncbi:protein-lysine N-methyltransferase [Martiniozyma asiatica (nom. inval.)]|nr:protein-lysine N-methyltransferase [Martiniozyma asiatica]